MGDKMDIDVVGPLDVSPPPNAEFCIFRAPRSEPRYLERYGLTLHNPDTSFKPEVGEFYIWSVFDLEDIGFKVFLNGSYNYKIESGVDKGVLRFDTDEHSPGATTCPRTRENLWFISYRLNQLPSEHIFYPQRPRGSSNIPPRANLSKGDLRDIDAARRREEEARKAAHPEPKAHNQKAPTPFGQLPFFSATDKSLVYGELEKKTIVVEDALKKWSEVPGSFQNTFDDLLKTLVGPSAIKRLTLIAHGCAGVIQRRDSMQYFHDMAHQPLWKRKPNNAATKIVRAHFGLPVEPLTALNIINAGKGTDDPRMEIERNIPAIQKELSKGSELDFLDAYTEPQLGEPGMIRAAPKPEDLKYKWALPQDLVDLLHEYDAAKKDLNPPTKTCHVPDGEVLDVDLHEDFSFLEEHRAKGFQYLRDSYRGGALPAGAALADEEVDGDADDDDNNEVTAPISDEVEGEFIGTRWGLLQKCEAYVDIWERSDPAIAKLCELNGNLPCLDKFKRPQKPNGKLNVDALRPYIAGLIESGQMMDALDLLEPRPENWSVPDLDSKEEPNNTKKRKTTEEILAPKQAGKYDHLYLETNYEVSLPIDWRHPDARFKLFGLVLNAYPDLVKKYRDASGKLDYASMLRDGFEVPVDKDADELINAGGDPEKSAKETEEWKKYLTYSIKTFQKEKPIRGGNLRGGSLRGGADPMLDPANRAGDGEEMIHGYPRKFLEDVYEIHKLPADRSTSAFSEHLKLSNMLVEDEDISNEWGDKPFKAAVIGIEPMYAAWIKNGKDMLEVDVYLQQGKKPSDTLYNRWEDKQKSEEKKRSQPKSDALSMATQEKSKAQSKTRKSQPNAAAPTPTPDKIGEQSKKKNQSPPKSNALTPPPDKGKNEQESTSGARGPGATAQTQSGQALVIEGVPFNAEQGHIFSRYIQQLRGLKAEKKAQSQAPPGNPDRGMRPLGPQLGQPHFVIPPEEEEEFDEEEAEALALARIELNGAEDDTPEARIHRIQRYKAARTEQKRRAAAKKAFVEDQSVHITEEDLPTIPEYGRSFEKAMDFHGVAPTLYLNNYTMKDIRELQYNLREMENMILGRQEYCGICDKYIKFENKLQKDNHYRGHRSIATSCGFCGISFDGMQDFERKQHLKKHANTKYGAQNQLRPYRNLDKQMQWPDDDIFVYCESCGMDLHSISTAAQMFSHIESCREKLDGNNGHRFDKADGDFFCTRCAQNLSLKSGPDRMKHTSMCEARHALGNHGRDNRIWHFATKYVPNKAVATEEDISRTYWHLMTLVGIPGRDDEPDEGHLHELQCKFHGCDADLRELATRDRLMEHLGIHIGHRNLRTYPCPIKGCSTDFTKWRTNLQTAKDEGAVFGTDLAEHIVKHMEEKHGAVRGAVAAAETRRKPEEKRNVGQRSEEDKQKEAAKRKEKESQAAHQQADKDRLAAESAAAAEKKRKEGEAKKAAVKSKPKAEEEGKTKKKKDGEGEGKEKTTKATKDRNSGDNDSGEATTEDSASDFEPGANLSSPSSDDDSDSAPEGGNDASGTFRKGAIDPKDADVALDKRPGVFTTFPKPWHAAIANHYLPKMTDEKIPPVAAMPGKQKTHPWVFACRGCGKYLLNYAQGIQAHRSVTSNGKKGCGLDDDMELVVSTKRHMGWYRQEMENRKMKMDPYLSPPPFLPSPPHTPFLWKTFREILNDPTMGGVSQKIREFLFEDVDVANVPKTTELPLLNGKKVPFNKSPYQKTKTKPVATAGGGASTSTDAAAAAAPKKDKEKKKKDLKERISTGKQGASTSADAAAAVAPAPAKEEKNTKRKTGDAGLGDGDASAVKKVKKAKSSTDKQGGSTSAAAAAAIAAVAAAAPAKEEKKKTAKRKTGDAGLGDGAASALKRGKNGVATK